MGQHVVIIDDSRTRRIVAELLHRAAAARWNGPASDLIIVEVEHPRAHGMDPVRTGATS